MFTIFFFSLFFNGISQTESELILIRDTIPISKTARVEIVKDSSYHQFQSYPEMTRVYIRDSLEAPTTIITIDGHGKIIDFIQNFQNKVSFSYDPESGKLKSISYETNKGNWKLKKMKN